MIPRILLRVAYALGALIVVGYAGLYFLQDYLIFQSVPLERTYKFTFAAPFEEHFIPVPNPNGAGDTLSALWFKPDSASKGLVIYFHGNRGNLQRWGQYAADFTVHGYEVLMIDYRGYGKSTGSPTEERLYRDAQAVYNWCTGKGLHGRLILYGRSLGSAVASHLAGHVNHDLLILETPFDELRGTMRPYAGPLAGLLPLRYTFSNAEHLRTAKARVVIFHGTRDTIVPLRSAERLRPLLATPADFIVVPGGGHRNLRSFPQYQERLKPLLQGSGF